MKTIFRFSVLALCACLTFTACKKDKGGKDDEETKFSEKSIEQNKADIQQAGIDFTNELKSMQDSKAINALLQLANLQHNGELKDYVLKSTDVESKLKGYDIPDELANTISEFSGVYVWNAETQTFDKTAASKENTATYKFPYGIGSQSNDCEINASVEYASNVKNLPAKATCELKINGTKCLGLSYVGTFTDEGYPTSIVESFEIDDFALTTNYTRNNSSFSVGVSFLHGTKTLLNTTTSVEGDLTDENIDKYVNATDEKTQSEFIYNVVSKLTFSTQVMNIKFVGSVSTKALAELDTQEGEESEISSKEDLQKAVDEVNNAIDCYVANTSENTKIADIKLFVVKDDYEDWEGNIVEDYDVEPKLVFADESSMDFETYFKDGFKDLEKAINDMEKSLEESLQKYGLISDDDDIIIDDEPTELED